jgi:CDP-glycerol glycerophosphotransferase (TagB/SpsB family)
VTNLFALKRLNRCLSKSFKQTDKRIVLFIDLELWTKEKITRILEGTTVAERKRLLIFHFDWELLGNNQDRSLQFVDINTYLNKQDSQGIADYADSLASGWHQWRRKGHSSSVGQYKDVQLGELLSCEFERMIIPKIRSLEVLRKMIETEKPGKVIVLSESDDFQRLALCAKEKYGGDVSISIFGLNNLDNQLQSLIMTFRNAFSDLLYCQILDRLINFIVTKRRMLKNVILIDPRAFNLLSGPHNLKNYLYSPLWKGWRIRWAMLKESKPYISLFVRSFKKNKNREDDFRKKWLLVNNENEFKKLFTYRGINYWLAVNRNLSQIFLTNFRELATIIENFRKFNDILKISCVVTRAYEVAKERAIIHAAKALRIPTVYLQHGATDYYKEFRNLFTDYAALWGEYDKDKLLNFGNPEKKLVVTGSQKYDNLYSRGRREKVRPLIKRLGIGKLQKVITIATQARDNYMLYVPRNDYMIILQKFLWELKDYPDICIVLKLHPFAHSVERYKELASRLKARNFRMVQNVNMLDLLELTDILVTVTSTVAFEAILLKKPVIRVDFFKDSDFYLDYVAKGAMLMLERQEEIAPTVRSILDDDSLKRRLNRNAEKILDYYLYKRDGQVSQRTVDLINSVKIN